jgi:hypothetical protein
VAKNSVQRLATGWTMRGPSSSPDRVNTSPYLRDRLWGPPDILIRWVQEALSPVIKRPEHEGVHSPPNSAEVNKTWIYIFTPPYAFMA